MRATINDIAKKAGVSKTTVSFAFNNPDKISGETRDRIMAIASELGYVPDPVARTLAMRQTGAIGVLLPQSVHEVFHNPYIAEILRGIGYVCDGSDVSLSILSPQNGVLTKTIRNAAVDGIITVGIGPGMSVLELLGQRRMPFVTIDGGKHTNLVNVGIDDEAAAEALMEEVLSRSHRDVAVFMLKRVTLSETGDHFSLTNDMRLNGFGKALDRYGLSFGQYSTARVCHTEATIESGKEAARELLALPRRPTAILCLADIQALGVYEACREAGLSIPKDISVVGFDDIPSASYLSPPLATVRQSGFDKGMHAARLVTDLIAKKPAESVCLDFTLELRESLGSL
ncbi:MAG: LacI family DNA-binding transcriptional regulator [Spirochaetales bacterium]|nr:LacI family DNA-binding transcriptional regulator [Spirochaetales bacterium]